jgi:glycosidase
MTTWYKPEDRNNKPNDGISVEEQEGQPAALLEHYRTLLALRNANAALRAGSWEPLAVENEKVYAYLRADSQSAFLVVLNFGSAPANISLDLARATLPNLPTQLANALTGQVLPVPGSRVNVDLEGAAGVILKINTP